MAQQLLQIEIEYAEDINESTAHAMVLALVDGEGVMTVRARVVPNWQSQDIGPSWPR